MSPHLYWQLWVLLTEFSLRNAHVASISDPQVKVVFIFTVSSCRGGEHDPDSRGGLVNEIHLKLK